MAFTFGRKKSKRTSGSPYNSLARVRREINVNMLFDTSGSMPEDAVDYLLGDGAQLIMSILKQHMGLDYHYNVRIATFASEVTEVLPFTPLEDAIGRSLPSVRAYGVTRTEDAVRDAIEAISKQKASQDAAHAPRGSSILVIITDGQPTDEYGDIIALDPTLVDEIAQLNRSRSVITYAVGMGSVNRSVLTQLAPADMIEQPNGTHIPFAHAVLYPEQDFSNVKVWEDVCLLVGNASRPTAAGAQGYNDKVVTGLAYQDAEIPDAYRTAAFVDPGAGVQLVY